MTRTACGSLLGVPCLLHFGNQKKKMLKDHSAVAASEAFGASGPWILSMVCLPIFIVQGTARGKRIQFCADCAVVFLSVSTTDFFCSAINPRCIAEVLSPGEGVTMLEPHTPCAHQRCDCI